MKCEAEYDKAYELHEEEDSEARAWFGSVESDPEDLAEIDPDGQSDDLFVSDGDQDGDFP